MSPSGRPSSAHKSFAERPVSTRIRASSSAAASRLLVAAPLRPDSPSRTLATLPLRALATSSRSSDGSAPSSKSAALASSPGPAPASAPPWGVGSSSTERSWLSTRATPSRRRSAGACCGTPPRMASAARGSQITAFPSASRRCRAEDSVRVRSSTICSHAATSSSGGTASDAAAKPEAPPPAPAALAVAAAFLGEPLMPLEDATTAAASSEPEPSPSSSLQLRPLLRLLLAVLLALLWLRLRGRRPRLPWRRSRACLWRRCLSSRSLLLPPSSEAPPSRLRLRRPRLRRWR